MTELILARRCERAKLARMHSPRTRATTVLVVRTGGKVVMGSDGQVTMGQTVVKSTARKLRRLNDGKIIAGFAGSAADGLTLFEKLEAKLKDASGNLMRAAVELAKDWRTDRVLRRLEALLLRRRSRAHPDALRHRRHHRTGFGCSSGRFGGNFALAAARALLAETKLSAREIAERSLGIAADICVYTNTHFVFEEL